MTQKEIGMNNRAVWITKIQEYDLTIKPTNFVRRRGLCKLIAENEKPLKEEGSAVPMALLVSLTDPWFSDVTYFLTYGEFPKNLTP